MLQGGTSTGRVLTDNCFVIDSPQALLNCRVAPPFQTQVKLLGVYPLPFWGIQTSATFQSVPGPMITANYVAPNSAIAPSLGRNLSSGANGTAAVPLIQPGTLGARMNQMDFRLSKLFRVWSGRRIQANMDLAHRVQRVGGHRAEQQLRCDLAAAEPDSAGPAAAVQRPVRLLGATGRAARAARPGSSTTEEDDAFASTS